MGPRRLGALCAAAILAAACSSAGGGASPTPSGSIDATLADWSITLSPPLGKAGTVTFTIKNAGANKHEFVVFKTDLAADKLPVANDEVQEDQLTKVDEKEDIESGSTATLTIDNLQPGHYVIICNITGHYEKGMHTDFTVSG
jgi:uncharacterized cupredoxin-like copper-binding protein